MAELEARMGAQPVERVLSEFDARGTQLADLSATTRDLVGTIMREEQIVIHSVQKRVKLRDKLKSKYCRPDKDYRCLDDISDLVGLRVITYYPDEIDRTVGVLKKEFGLLGPVDDKRIGDAGSFGYSAVHLDCEYLKSRLDSTEYKRFAGARFEIQITTIIGHAWAEMHHAWYDEVSSPLEEERRFRRLAAVLELAEQEFLEVRRRKDERERVASVRVEARAPEVPVTLESLKAFFEQGSTQGLDSEVAKCVFARSVSASPANWELLLKIVHATGVQTIGDLEAKLARSKDAVIEFATRSKPIWDAARPLTSTTYAPGISILHLATMISLANGVDQYQKFAEDVKLHFFPNVDLDALSAVARDVVERHKVV